MSAFTSGFLILANYRIKIMGVIFGQRKSFYFTLVAPDLTPSFINIKCNQSYEKRRTKNP